MNDHANDSQVSTQMHVNDSQGLSSSSAASNFRTEEAFWKVDETSLREPQQIQLHKEIDTWIANTWMTENLHKNIIDACFLSQDR